MPSWTPSTMSGKEHLMAMSLDEFLVEHPVDRAAVDAHKQHMLEAIAEALREEGEEAPE